MDTTILGVANGKHRDTKTNRTTLNSNHLCDKCGEPAMVSEGGGLRCPRCWLAEKGKQIKPLDHAGYYP